MSPPGSRARAGESAPPPPATARSWLNSTDGGLAVVETATKRAQTTLPQPSLSEVQSVPACQDAVRNRLSLVPIQPGWPGWSALGGTPVAPMYGSLSALATVPARGVPGTVSRPTLGLLVSTP